MIFFQGTKDINRDSFFDALKGLAIFLMVVGHAIAWMYPEETLYSFKNNLGVNVIYSFHMPLLFVVSGYFFPKGNGVSLDNFVKICGKKILRLLVPFFVGGVLYCFFRGLKITTLWFLQALFWFSLINLLWEIVRKNVKKYVLPLDVLFYFLTFVILKIITPLPISNSLALDSTMYVAFSFGIVMKRYCLAEQVESNVVFNIALVVFVITNYFLFKGVTFPCYKVITGLSGSVACWNFIRIFKKESFIYKFFSTCGLFSLEIYILHVFFVLKIPQLGYFVDSIRGFRDDLISRSLVEFLIAMGLAFVSIGFCVVLARFLKKSSLLNFILFGSLK